MHGSSYHQLRNADPGVSQNKPVTIEVKFMLRQIVSIRILFLLILVFAAIQIAYSQGFTVIGQIIDRKGDSVPNAKVVPRLQCPTCPDLTVPAAISNGDGYFSLSMDYVPGRLNIDVLGPTPDGSWNPFVQMDELAPPAAQTDSDPYEWPSSRSNGEDSSKCSVQIGVN